MAQARKAAQELPAAHLAQGQEAEAFCKKARLSKVEWAAGLLFTHYPRPYLIQVAAQEMAQFPTLSAAVCRVSTRRQIRAAVADHKPTAAAAL